MAVLAVHGEQGAAKSSFCRLMRRLIDPSKAPLRSPPEDERDLLIHASNAWVLGFDNLSNITQQQSDWLCRIATAGGFGTRRLHTDDEEQVFDARRPVVMNGIVDFSNRSDLLDRALVVELAPIPDHQRRTDEEIDARFMAAHPRILGVLLDGVAAALRNSAAVTVDLPRMADFARWVVAAEPALGFAPGPSWRPTARIGRAVTRPRSTPHR